LQIVSDLATAIGASGRTGDGWERERSDHVLAAALLPGGVPTVFVASELTEVAYYVALRSCIVSQRQAALERFA
jgi:hypothetical protein